MSTMGDKSKEQNQLEQQQKMQPKLSPQYQMQRNPWGTNPWQQYNPTGTNSGPMNAAPMYYGM